MKTTLNPSAISSVCLIIGLIVAISGCVTVGPDYVRQPIDSPETWHTDMPNRQKTDTHDMKNQADWWTVFSDPILSELMDRAVADNLDLKIAISRLTEARARRGISKAQAYPTLDTNAGAKKTESHTDNGPDTTRELYTAGIDSIWELDIFGGTRRSVEAAQASVAAAEGNLGNVQVSLLAETALNYIEMRTLQEKLAITEENIRSREETSRLVAWRLSAGLANELEMEQARYSLASTLSTRPALISQLEAVKNRLAVLLGASPGSLHQQLKPSGDIPVPPVCIAVGIPADVLRQRPDVYKAERELAAQTAMIGVAAAQRYPQFSLKGAIGIEALSARSFFSLTNRTSSIGPQAVWSIFDGGAVKRNIDVQSALKDQALCQYESAILTALEEVENALSAFSGEQDRISFLDEAVRAAGESEKLAKIRYESGLSDFSIVLEAQRSLLSFQSQLADSKALSATNFITLYKALGGGWQPLE